MVNDDDGSPLTGSIDLAPVIDLGLARENRALRDRVAQLETAVAAQQRLLAQQPPLTVNSEDPHRSCRFHLHVFVNEHAPKVTCRDCGEELDAYTVLLQYARRERQFMWIDADLNKRKVEIQRELAALEKQRKALRARVRRAGGRPITFMELAALERAEALAAAKKGSS